MAKSHMAPKTTKTPGGKKMTQKLGSTKGIGLNSVGEGSAKLPYLGHSLSDGVKNGTHGLLAGTGGSIKKAKIPT